MRKSITLLSLSAALFLVAGTVMAQDEGTPEEAAAEAPAAEAPAAEATKAKSSGGRKYGPAGCGLGSLIFEPDSGFTQIFAATTNGTSANQTFGISSGPSNCDDSGGGEESAKSFVQTNRAALAKDIARGKGETIATLSELAACGDARVVGKRLQKKFRAIFPSSKVSDQEVSNRVVDVLREDSALQCSNLT